METLSKVLIYVILILYALIIIFPFSMVLVTAFKSKIDSRDPNFTLFPPNGYSLEAFKEVFNYRLTLKIPLMVQGLLNTLMYVIPPTFLGLFTSSLAAYAFSKLRFRAKNVMYAVLLATMMIPGTITIAPQYSMY